MEALQSYDSLNKSELPEITSSSLWSRFTGIVKVGTIDGVLESFFVGGDGGVLAADRTYLS